MDNKIRGSHTWSKILEINAFKQALFMERVLWLHDLASRRSKGRASVRLGSQEWQEEADRMALAGHILEALATMIHDDGAKLFSDEVMEKIRTRIVEG